MRLSSGTRLRISHAIANLMSFNARKCSRLNKRKSRKSGRLPCSMSAKMWPATKLCRTGSANNFNAHAQISRSSSRVSRLLISVCKSVRAAIHPYVWGATRLRHFTMAKTSATGFQGCVGQVVIEKSRQYVYSHLRGRRAVVLISRASWELPRINIWLIRDAKTA